ncbi:MAG: hypothetical protein LBG80_10405 [Bacteroidales bacterium]|jgi:RHS repeat-associated protein|nr:hypothetical protein [Bacteroidales bacterium]
MKKLFLTLFVLLAAVSGYVSGAAGCRIMSANNDANGTAAFKVSYDVWGKQTVTNNTFKFHRGFTGHEHLPEFALINMNGRMYDPILGRFLSPDPSYVQAPEFSQNFNRYSYCVNNPLLYTDPSGEIIFTVLSAIFCPELLPLAIKTDMGWMGGGYNSKANGGSFWEGALVGGMMGAMNGALSMALPIKKIPFGNSGLNLIIAPQFAVGTDGLGFGVNFTFGYDFSKKFSAGLNFGGTYYFSAAGTEASGLEGRVGYGAGYKSEKFQAGIGSTYFFSGETSQQTGQIYAGGGNWRVTYENDTWAPVPGLWSGGGSESDKFRTAALRFDLTGGRFKGVNAGLSIFTGQASEGMKDGAFTGASANKYRMGAIYVGYNAGYDSRYDSGYDNSKYKSINMRIGYNSEKNIRGPVQNSFHNLFDYPHFEVLNMRDRLYFGAYSLNPYTLW